MSSTKDAVKYQIRVAELPDAATIANIGKQTFIETFGEQNIAEDMALYVDTHFTTDVITREISDESNTFLLMLHHDTVMGYAKMRKTDATENGVSENALELQRIYILHKYHGKGAGTLLMQTCLDHARRNDYNEVWLGVWEYNLKALAFYKKFGFEQFGSHNFQLGSDAQTDLLMKKILL